MPKRKDVASSSSGKRKDQFRIEHQEALLRLVDQEELKVCVEEAGQRTPAPPEAARGVASPMEGSPALLLAQLKANLGKQLDGHRVDSSPPLPQLGDRQGCVEFLTGTRKGYKKRVVSKETVDRAKESARNLKRKGYVNLNEDEAELLKSNIYFLAKLNDSPHPFREEALKVYEDMVHHIRCLRQQRQTRDLVEEERRIISDLEIRIEARNTENKQFDREVELITSELAKELEEKLDLDKKLFDMCLKMIEPSTALFYMYGIGDQPKV
ncbi:uncharacterized protein LOC126788801 [Argentina anserina]|uniref:uncharacterized protein LOC126788801 n=1 Tax=Argentina anserina TaxID=57926 RepID=UPI00217656E9|nr:uncharacterized protein LOC126788801 [Potentilla anserina]XP_050370770.1 uncharacterized protein LOC126788801 [Potentilla anserina]